MSDGERCPDCGETHNDWEQIGRHGVNGPYHAGIVETYECGNCGNTIQVCRR